MPPDSKSVKMTNEKGITAWQNSVAREFHINASRVFKTSFIANISNGEEFEFIV